MRHHNRPSVTQNENVIRNAIKCAAAFSCVHLLPWSETWFCSYCRPVAGASNILSNHQTSILNFRRAPKPWRIPLICSLSNGHWSIFHYATLSHRYNLNSPLVDTGVLSPCSFLLFAQKAVRHPTVILFLVKSKSHLKRSPEMQSWRVRVLIGTCNVSISLGFGFPRGNSPWLGPQKSWLYAPKEIKIASLFQSSLIWISITEQVGNIS